MKREMQQDFQNYIQQTQGADPRKQRVQRQKQPSQDAGGFFPGDNNRVTASRESTKRNQIADEVFNEILNKKTKAQEYLPSKVGSSKFIVNSHV